MSFFLHLNCSCVFNPSCVFIVVSLWIMLHIYVHVCRCESAYVTIQHLPFMSVRLNFKKLKLRNFKIHFQYFFDNTLYIYIYIYGEIREKEEQRRKRGEKEKYGFSLPVTHSLSISLFLSVCLCLSLSLFLFLSLCLFSPHKKTHLSYLEKLNMKGE